MILGKGEAQSKENPSERNVLLPEGAEQQSKLRVAEFCLLSVLGFLWFPAKALPGSFVPELKPLKLLVRFLLCDGVM